MYSLCWLVANLYMPGFLRASGCLLKYDKKSTDGQTRCGNLPAEALQEPDGEVVFSLLILISLWTTYFCSLKSLAKFDSFHSGDFAKEKKKDCNIGTCISANV